MLLLASALAEPAPSPAVFLGTRAGIGVSKPKGYASTGLGLVGLSAAYRATPVFSVEVSASAGQSFDQRLFPRGEWKDIVKSVDSVPTTPIARVGWVAEAMVVFTPLQGVLVAPEQAGLGFDLGVGGGVVRTIDDPVAMATQRQSHPGWVLTAGPRVSTLSGWELSLRVRSRQWIEVFEGINLRLTTLTDVGLGVSRRL